jgi:HAD superfamily hydrolase (TIGR01509 family)
MNTMPRAIIFDFYGVLALNGWQEFKQRHFADRPEVWDQVYRLGRRVDAREVSRDELVAFTAKVSGQSEATVREQLDHSVANDELFDYIAADLHGRCKLGILSNASTNVVEHILSPEQAALFDAAVLSHHVGMTKPDVRMYRHIAEKLGVAPAECVFVDDQARHLAGAAAAGMQTILYTNFMQLKHDLTESLEAKA